MNIVWAFVGLLPAFLAVVLWAARARTAGATKATTQRLAWIVPPLLTAVLLTWAALAPSGEPVAWGLSSQQLFLLLGGLLAIAVWLAMVFADGVAFVSRLLTRMAERDSR